jgi:hypothetical protein
VAGRVGFTSEREPKKHRILIGKRVVTCKTSKEMEGENILLINNWSKGVWIFPKIGSNPGIRLVLL